MKFRNRTVDLDTIAIVLFLAAAYSCGTLTSITVSWTIPRVLIILAIGILAVKNIIEHGTIYANSMSIAWGMAIIVCFFATLRSEISRDLFFYVLTGVVLLFSFGLKTEALDKGMRIMMVLGFVFALGCIWQHFFPSQYYARLYPLFGSEYRHSIKRQFTINKMCTGFTSQTAVAAQFISLGLMAFVYRYSGTGNMKRKIIKIVGVAVLVYGLLLTGKRSPILVLTVVFLVIDMLTVERKKQVGRVLGIIAGLLAAIIVLSAIVPSISNSRNSLVRLFEYLETDDVDISNGRFTLSALALSEFYNHPLLGIGWGKYGVLHNVAGVHNIFLQLLCECGIVGCIVFIGVMIYALAVTVKQLKSRRGETEDTITRLLKCSAFIQIYTITYGLFGNPLYDMNFFFMYIFGLILASSVRTNNLLDSAGLACGINRT